jgi:hypothetical protein
MSIKPPIKCPPDYSILTFRLTECKKAGIVKGINTQLAIDLQDLFVPVTNYEERQITLKSGETKKIDVSSLGVHWPLKEKYEFVADATNCGLGTQHTYTLSDSNNVTIESLNINVNNTNPTFAAAFAAAVTASTSIKNLITFDTNRFIDETGVITATAINKGIKYRHLFQFDLTGFGGYYPFPYLHPGNLITPYQKYDHPRVKILMIYPDYYKANVLANCGCIDSSGDLKSNKKYIEYAYADQYAMIDNPSTPVTATPVLNSNPLGQQWTWDSTSTDHFGYHFKNSDLASFTSNPGLRGIISDVQGYFFATDTVVGNLSAAQSLSHVYSPNSVKWRKIGDFYLHTSAQDVTDDDYLYQESVWLRNPNGFDLPIKIMLAS